MRRKKLVQNLVVGTLFLVVLLFGAWPILNRDDSFYDRFGHATGDSYDIVVLGSEPEGIAAALAAARTGMRVLLATTEPDPSSYLTDCLIPYMPHQTGRLGDKRLSLSGPVFSALFGSVESTFTSADWLRGAHSLLKNEPGLEITFESTLTGVRTVGRRLSSIDMYTSGGTRTFEARVFLDATESGVLLERLAVPYQVGSEDIGASGFFEPVAFQFRISGVNWEDIRTIAKVNDLYAEFSDVLFLYPRSRNDIKLLSPSLIRQEEDTVVFSGLRLGFVNPGDPVEMDEAYQNGLREAMLLTAYLQTELIPFEDAKWDVAASRLFVPEYKHYQGMETLSVADILLNRDRSDKVAVLADPVTANRFVRGDDPAVLCAPNAYAVPIGCLVPQGYANILMLGRNASYASLASTSAATPSARVVVAEGAGLAAAWCVLEKTDPVDVPGLSAERHAEFVSFLERAGQVLPEIQEPVLQPDGSSLTDAWMAEDVVALVSLGVLTGGLDNDFRLEENCSAEVLSVLAKNTLIRLAPSHYSLDLDARLAPLATEEAVTAEQASLILLELADVPLAQGKNARTRLFDWLEASSEWTAPKELLAGWSGTGPVKNGELYHLVLAVCKVLAG